MLPKLMVLLPNEIVHIEMGELYSAVIVPLPSIVTAVFAEVVEDIIILDGLITFQLLNVSPEGIMALSVVDPIVDTMLPLAYCVPPRVMFPLEGESSRVTSYGENM